MSLDQLKINSPGSVRLKLRELNGFDEQSVSNVDTATAINLIDRLLVRLSGSFAENLKAAELTSSDRDRLLAEVYDQTFGPRIESTIRCESCAELFDLTFTIRDLIGSLNSASSAPRDPDGTYRMANGLRFRLPIGTDELAVVGLEPDVALQELIKRCVLGSNESIGAIEIDEVQEAMEDVAPILDRELEARCPECGSKHSVHFDIQFYLLRAFLQEKKRVGREIHRLAIAYGWSLNEILSLTRSQRRTFVELIEADFSRRARLYA